jgi:hypothetical protein
MNIDVEKMKALIAEETKNSSPYWCESRVAIGEINGIQIQIVFVADEDDFIEDESYRMVKA